MIRGTFRSAYIITKIATAAKRLGGRGPAAELPLLAGAFE